MLVEEAITLGVPVLAVDPQGDLVQFLCRRDRQSVPSDLNPGYERFCERVEPRIFTPGSSHGKRLCLSPIRVPGTLEGPDSERGREERESLITTMAGNLVRLAKAGGDTDCQQTFLFQVLQRLVSGGRGQETRAQREETGALRSGGRGPETPALRSAGRGEETRAQRGETGAQGGICGQGSEALGLDAVAAAVARPDSIGIIDPNVFLKKAERERLARKLNNLLFGPLSHLFNGGQSLDLEELLRPREPGKVSLNVIYLNALPDDEQKQFFVAALATEVYRWMIGSGGDRSLPQMLFYLDEARDYLPAGLRKPPAKEPLLRLFAQGRKYGVACLLCTQSPRGVDYQAFGNCSTKIVGRLESAQDVARVGEWFSKDGPVPAWLHGRKGAAPGSFVGRWPDMPEELEGQSWQSRCLFSMHEGAWPPERVERELHAVTAAHG
jgi:DNA helicase HerA-like ATPase